MSDITLTLSAEETVSILQVLGQLPTSSNAYPLMVKINEQLQGQIPKNQDDVV
jgi:hypothetical protein